MTQKIYIGYDNSYTYVLDAEGQAVTGFYDDQDPVGITREVMEAALKRVGAEIIDMGDVYEAILQAWADEHPDDPEGNNLESDTDYLVRAFAKGYINLEEEE